MDTSIIQKKIQDECIWRKLRSFYLQTYLFFTIIDIVNEFTPYVVIVLNITPLR